MPKNATDAALERQIEILHKEISRLGKNEQELRDNENKLRSLVETTTDLVWEIDLNGVYTYAGPSVKGLLGYNVDEIMGTTIFDSVLREEKKRTKAFFEKGCKMPKPFSGWRVRLLHKDGKQVIVEINGTPLMDRDKGLTGWCGFDKDITDRVMAQESLQESEKRYRHLFENVQAGVFRATLNGSCFLAVNKVFSDIFGYATEKMREQVVPAKLVSPENWHVMLEKLQARGRLEDYEVAAITRSGEKITCLTSLKLFHREAYLEGTVIDITRRKKTEQALQRAHAELTQTNALLHREIEEKKLAERALIDREEDLKRKAHDLQEANTALKVLLKHREEDKTELEEKVSTNVKKLVVPYLEELEKSRLSSTQKTYFDILRSNLQEIISPFTRRLSAEFANLTPTEIKTANLVKLGKTTNEISELMRISEKTVEHHRDAIRHKLGIKNKKINLTSHLLSYE